MCQALFSAPGGISRIQSMYYLLYRAEGVRYNQQVSWAPFNCFHQQRTEGSGLALPRKIPHV